MEKITRIVTERKYNVKGKNLKTGESKDFGVYPLTEAINTQSRLIRKVKEDFGLGGCLGRNWSVFIAGVEEHSKKYTMPLSVFVQYAELEETADEE